jgi:hypothetical protein
MEAFIAERAVTGRLLFRLKAPPKYVPFYTSFCF